MSTVVDVTTVRGLSGSTAASRWRRDRRFFTGMAVAAAVTIFAGFAPTYYLKGVYGTKALSTLLHVHGALFTSWMVLLLVQTSLVAARRTDLHKRLGIAGAVLAVLMAVAGLAAAEDAMRRGSSIPGLSPLAFFAVPFGSVVVFPALVGAALFLRRHTEAHKRLMLIGTAELLAPGLGRVPAIAQWGPLGFFGLSDLFVVALAIYDLRTRGRIHAATLWGGLFLIASQPLRMLIAGTDAWLSFAGWLTS